MPTKIELKEQLDREIYNSAVMNDELLILQDIIDRAIDKRAELLLTRTDSIGIAAAVSVKDRLQLIKDIFGEGEEDVLQEV